METNQATLYQQLGAEENIAAVVDDFYRRILADDSLNQLFSDTDMETLKRHQTLFLTFALGGPNQYTGRSMQKAHEGLNITPEQFNTVAGHLTASLESFDVPPANIDQVITKVASLKNDVVGK